MKKINIILLFSILIVPQYLKATEIQDTHIASYVHEIEQAFLTKNHPRLMDQISRDFVYKIEIVREGQINQYEWTFGEYREGTSDMFSSNAIIKEFTIEILETTKTGDNIYLKTKTKSVVEHNNQINDCDVLSTEHLINYSNSLKIVSYQGVSNCNIK